MAGKTIDSIKTDYDSVKDRISDTSYDKIGQLYNNNNEVRELIDEVYQAIIDGTITEGGNALANYAVLYERFITARMLNTLSSINDYAKLDATWKDYAKEGGKWPFAQNWINGEAIDKAVSEIWRKIGDIREGWKSAHENKNAKRSASWDELSEEDKRDTSKEALKDWKTKLMDSFLTDPKGLKALLEKDSIRKVFGAEMSESIKEVAIQMKRELNSQEDFQSILAEIKKYADEKDIPIIEVINDSINRFPDSYNLYLKPEKKADDKTKAPDNSPNNQSNEESKD